MKLADLKIGWDNLSGKARLMALGTAAIFGFSLCFSLGNCSLIQDAGEGMRRSTSITVEEGVEIPRDAEPISVASDDTRLVTALVDVLANRECLWVSAEDDLCWLEFTEDSFTEYNGDIAKVATVEFYSIEVVENGREGTWRVTYEDGSVYDASFRFVQNREAGVYVITSSAFPTFKSYQTAAITASDVLAW